MPWQFSFLNLVCCVGNFRKNLISHPIILRFRGFAVLHNKSLFKLHNQSIPMVIFIYHTADDINWWSTLILHDGFMLNY